MKCRFLFSIACLLLILVGCVNTANDHMGDSQDKTNAGAVQSMVNTDIYSIVLTKDKYFLSFTDKLNEIIMQQEAMEQVVFSHPAFSSVKEMKSRILEGHITADEMGLLYRYAKGQSIEICNLDNLYDIRLPKDTQLRFVSWYGDGYSFSFQGDRVNGKLRPVTQAEFQNALHNEYTSFPYSDFTIISETAVSDRNACEVIFETSKARIKSVLYAVDIDNGTIFIREDYPMEYFTAVDLTASDSIPSTVYLFGQQEDAYFTGYLLEIEERPNMQWLSSFGLERLNENE